MPLAAPHILSAQPRLVYVEYPRSLRQELYQGSGIPLARENVSCCVGLHRNPLDLLVPHLQIVTEDVIDLVSLALDALLRLHLVDDFLCTKQIMILFKNIKDRPRDSSSSQMLVVTLRLQLL